MRESYDFSKGTRGVHAARYAEGVEVIIDGKPPEPNDALVLVPAVDTEEGSELPPATVVALESDVSAVFPNAESVNEALRLLIKTAKSAQELAKAS